MFRHPKLRPKSHIPGLPDDLYDFAGLTSLPGLSSGPSLSEHKQDHGIYRVKRKHVLKACDRCRVKKTKCDGKQPCNRCSTYNHPCLFRERKATQTKVYSRGFVEMLESHHALVVKGLQKLYKHCVNKEGFPGEPLAEGADGYPLTHEILDRLGLIKQAEESPDELEESTLEDLRYLQVLSASTETSSQSDPSPEPVTPPNPSPVTAKMATTTSTMTSSACSSMMPSPSMGGDISWQQWPWPEPELPSPAFSHLFPDYDYAGSVQLPTALSPSMTTAPFHAQLHNLPAQYPHHHGQGSSLPLFFISGGMHNEHTPVPAPLPASMSVETGHPHYPFG